MNNIKYKKNDLLIEGVSVRNLAKKFPTPFYCYSSKTIIEKFKKFKNSLKIDALICYAVKANPNIAILKILSKQGAGTEVVSEGELIRSLKAKINPKKIVFSGVGKSLNAIKLAVKKNILQINVESEEELELIEEITKKLKKRMQIGIRVNPDIDAKTHKKISTGRKEDKFGIDIKIAEKIFNNYRFNKYLDVIGLSVHIGSQITSLNPFKRAFLKISRMVKKININQKIIKILDLGGGIGINYNNDKVINFNDYAKIISKISKDLDCKLILEPGRMLVAESGILLTKVLYIKKNKKNNFAIIDAGMNDLLRPALYDAYHEIESVKNNKGQKKKYTIVGPICETTDKFLSITKFQMLNEGDCLAICDVGAYGMVLSSNYNLRTKPPEILINKSLSKVIKKRQKLINII